MKEGLRFDWYQRINLTHLTPLVDEVIDACLSAYKNQNASREAEYKKLCWSMISALYQSYCSLPLGQHPISVPKKSSAYNLNASTANKVKFNSRYVFNLVDVLTQKGWIKVYPGQEHKGYTRIKSAGNLLKEFKAIGLKWTQQEPMAKDGLVVLRDREPTTSSKKKFRKFDIPTPSTPEVMQYQDDLFTYNQFLLQHCVSLDLTDNQLLEVTKSLKKSADEGFQYEDEREVHLDFNRLQLRRIFSRASLTKGGRFYGGWWQSLPSIYRGHILINGYKTVEVDYSGMSLRIWLGLNDHKLGIEDDVYNLGFSDWQGDSDPRRKPIKTFLNAKLNDEEGNFRLSKKDQRLAGVSHEDLTAMLFEKYTALEADIHAGIGLDTQFYDSQLAMSVMRKMLAEGILVLPIHDSFIIRAGFQQYLEKTMVIAFEESFSASIGTSVEGTRLMQHFGLDKQAFKSLRAGDEQVTNLANVSDLYTSQSRIMDGYRSEWEHQQA